jgi:hypothetical protein
MKSLIIASGIVIAVSALTILVLINVGVPAEVASGVWTILGSIPFVHQVIQKKNPSPTLNVLPVDIVQPQLFYLPWHNMIIYSGMLFAAAINLGSFIGGLVVGISDPSLSEGLSAVYISGYGAGLLGAFAIGSWIGRRCDRYGVIVVLASVCLGILLTSFIDFIYISTADSLPEPFRERVSNALDPTVMLSSFLLHIIVFSSAMLFGYWWGKRRRQAAYVAFLLSRLPAEAQNVLADLAYEESRRLQGVQMRV